MHYSLSRARQNRSTEIQDSGCSWIWHARETELCRAISVGFQGFWWFYWILIIFRPIEAWSLKAERSSDFRAVGWERVYIYSLSHHPASQKLLKVFVRQCASIDLKITKLYENPEKPSNPTEMARRSSVSRACENQLQAISRKAVDRGYRILNGF